MDPPAPSGLRRAGDEAGEDASRCGASERAPGADVDWDAVRRAYELTGESVAAIRRRFGVTPWQLRKQRVAGGWTTRPPAAEPGPRQGRKPIGEEALELRMNRLIVTGMAMLEHKLAKEGMTEANARTLTELVRAQETKMRNKKAVKAREKKNHADYRDDPAWARAELKRRVRRIRAAMGLQEADRQSGD